MLAVSRKEILRPSCFELFQIHVKHKLEICLSQFQESDGMATVSSGMLLRRESLQFWCKPTWHVQDGYEHEFFNASDLSNSRTIAFSKGKRYRGTTPYDGSGNSNTVENKNALVCSAA